MIVPPSASVSTNSLAKAGMGGIGAVRSQREFGVGSELQIAAAAGAVQ